MTDWTIKRVADRFEEAAGTAYRLPPVRVQGYVNCWPIIARKPWETYAAEPLVRRYPPSPAAIDRMLEVMQWVAWLDEEQRHLLWMRAQRYPWRGSLRPIRVRSEHGLAALAEGLGERD